MNNGGTVSDGRVSPLRHLFGQLLIAACQLFLINLLCDFQSWDQLSALPPTKAQDADFWECARTNGKSLLAHLKAATVNNEGLESRLLAGLQLSVGIKSTVDIS